MEFGQAIAAVVERDAKSWSNGFQTFVQYSPGMTLSARQTKYNELVLRLESLKQRAQSIRRPDISEARSAHDKYMQMWSKVAEVFTAINYGDLRRVQSLVDEATLLQKQFDEQMNDLLKKYGLTRSDVGLP